VQAGWKSREFFAFTGPVADPTREGASSTPFFKRKERKERQVRQEKTRPIFCRFAVFAPLCAFALKRVEVAPDNAFGHDRAFGQKR
jgi:hypothetical protein